MPARPGPDRPALSRRGWLAAVAVTMAAARARALADDPAPDEAEATQAAEVRKRAEDAGIGALGEGRTGLYLGLGDAPEAFRKAALALCEDLAEDYLKHFADKGFAVERPASRLVVVLLASPQEFARYLELDDAGPVRGIYDLDTNRLVVCDNRAERNPLAERANSVALHHEATHQLTFNTGLLDRAGDVPLAVSEGLAMYGEVRRPKGQTKVGAANTEWLKVLADLSRRGGRLIPLERLLVEDELLNDPQDQNVARAESWVLVHLLMTDRALLPKFRDYLDAIRPRRDASDRLDDARATLGDPEALDRALAQHANRLMRKLR
jgi:hypothetical protein